MGPHKKMLTVDGKPVADAVISTQIVSTPRPAPGTGRTRHPGHPGAGLPQGRRSRLAGRPAGRALIDVPFYRPGRIRRHRRCHRRQHLGQEDRRGRRPAQQAAAIEQGAELVRLQRLPNADKKVAMLFWNRRAKNMSASFMNLLRRNHARPCASRPTPMAKPKKADQTCNACSPLHRDGELAGLLRDGLAERLPVATYKAWLQRQPAAVQDELRERWGDPEKSAMVTVDRGEAVFVMPRPAVGKVIFSPQAPRGERWEEKKKPSTTRPRRRRRISTWPTTCGCARLQGRALVTTARTAAGMAAGKERGLAVTDYPLLAIGDAVVCLHRRQHGEALQAKRRGRAVIVTHQTPLFRAGRAASNR
jgi:cobaltochelatase CobN